MIRIMGFLSVVTNKAALEENLAPMLFLRTHRLKLFMVSSLDDR